MSSRQMRWRIADGFAICEQWCCCCGCDNKGASEVVCCSCEKTNLIMLPIWYHKLELDELVEQGLQDTDPNNVFDHGHLHHHHVACLQNIAAMVESKSAHVFTSLWIVTIAETLHDVYFETHGSAMLQYETSDHGAI